MRPELAESTAHPPKPPGALRIVSLNTWKCDGDYALRLPLMVEGLRALQPDIVLLQEVFRTLDGTWNTASTVASALHMQATCAWARRKPRELQGQWRESDSGMAVLSALPVQEHWPIQLPAAPEDGERVAQLVRLQWAGEPLWLANLHLSHLPHAHALRLAQLHTVLAHMALESLSGSVWALGDFNAALSADAAWLNPPAPWRAEDAFAPSQKESKVTHRDASGAGHDLDQCLQLWRAGAGTLKVAEARLALNVAEKGTGLLPSDHAGLCVDLQRAQAAPQRL